MTTGNVWQQATDLTNRVFQVTSGLDLPRGNHWPTVMTVGLSQANERLDSVRTLLDKGHWDSAAILARSLFELAVNLAYIAKDTQKRLPQYLKHGGIPLTSEDAQQLQRELAQEQRLAMNNVVPKRTWRPLRDMCCALGQQWVGVYDRFYRYVSVPTHAGSFTLGGNYVQLLEQKPPSDHDRALVLVTALRFQLLVASIAANIFPKQINLQTVGDMVSECDRLGQSL